MIAQHEMTIDDYLSILRRRIWLLVIPAVVCAAGAYTVSLFLPSKWTSETVVLVEEPAEPDKIVKPVISGELNQRVATMKEQSGKQTRLPQMIEKIGIFPEDGGKR